MQTFKQNFVLRHWVPGVPPLLKTTPLFTPTNWDESIVHAVSQSLMEFEVFEAAWSRAESIVDVVYIVQRTSRVQLTPVKHWASNFRSSSWSSRISGNTSPSKYRWCLLARDGTGSPCHGSPVQRFWPGRVRSGHGSVCQTRCLTRSWVLTCALISWRCFYRVTPSRQTNIRGFGVGSVPVTALLVYLGLFQLVIQCP